jgi:hypothetical protein
MNKFQSDQDRNKPTVTIKQLDCDDPLHNPIRSLHTGPGMYEHICPNCGKKTLFTVPSTPRH